LFNGFPRSTAPACFFAALCSARVGPAGITR